MNDLMVAVLTGILQGLLEWLPVSSKSFLMIFFNSVLGIGEEQSYYTSIALHLSTSLAAALYFREEVLLVFKDKELLVKMALACISSAIVGLPLYYVVTEALFKSGATLSAIIGLFLVVTGLVLLLRAKATSEGKLTMLTLKRSHYLLTGAVQGLSVVPGLSRSGLTVTALLLLGAKADESMKTSFLMGIPVALAYSLFSFSKLSPAEAIPLDSILYASILAFVISLGTIKLLLRAAEKLLWAYFLILFGTLALLLNALVALLG